MPQRGSNPNEVLFEDNTAFGYYVTNYSDYEHLICRSPEDILAAIEEQFSSPLAFVQYREERITQWHVRFTKDTPIKTTTATKQQLIAIDTERDRLLEFFIHERITK